MSLRFGSYEVLLQLASGGMGRVYVARKLGAAGFERLAVVKRVHSHLLDDPELRDTLRDEAQIAALIMHPNVVGVEDVIDAGGELVLVQPYVESVSLSSLLRAAAASGRLLPPAAVVRIVSDVLAGLHAAHEARDLRGGLLHVVHRDVSPHNVLVGVDGRSRLIDFGIAKAERRITQTTPGVLKGKLAYMAPEALRRDAVDRRTDVFAAGVMLHEALTGRRLFDGEDEGAVLLSVMVQEIDRPSALAPGTPSALDDAVLRALERDPRDRFATAFDLLDAIEHALPPAAPREVADLLNAFCGDRMQGLRERIRRALDSDAPAVRAASVGEPPDGRPIVVERPPRPASDPPPVAATGVPSPRSAAALAGAAPLEPTRTIVEPRRGGGARAARLFAVALLIGMGVTAALHEVRAPATSPPGPSPAPSSSVAPPPTPVAAEPPAATPAQVGPAETVREPPPPRSAPVAVQRAPQSAPGPSRSSELHKNPYDVPR